MYGPITYNADGLITAHNADFLRDPRFMAAYKLGADSDHGFGPDLHIEWRSYVNCWAADHARHLEGDFVECGTNTGIYARTITEFVNFATLPKTFWLMDTFGGYPEDQLTVAERAHGQSRLAEQYSDVYADVAGYFSKFANVTLIRGRIPETLPMCTAEKISYLSIDLNALVPEIAAITHFWERIVSGGIVVLDDYGWGPCIEQKHAMDNFARAHDIQVLPLPTGQGIIIKPN